MDLKQMNYFITTIEEGNISRAAQKLHISQPPLSTKLKELETELGVVLFERGSRTIQLTEAGKLFYARAQSILELVDMTKKELQDYKAGKLGTLRIGIVSSVSSTLINDWLISFHAAYPNIHFSIFEGNTYEQLDKLRSNLIELAIVRTPFSSNELECTLLKEEKLYAVGASKYFNGLSNPTLSLSSLLEVPLIIYRRWEKVIKDFFIERGLHPNILCINDDARTTASMTNAHLGIGIIPESAISLLSKESIITKELIDPCLSTNICLLCNPNSYHSTVVELFYDHLKAYVKLDK